MKSRGFTIIEIIVVIGIIAVLTVIAFPAINNIRAKNRDTERVADIGALQIGLALYSSQHSTSTGGYPKSLSDLVLGGYVPSDAVLDPTGTQYTYIPLTRDPANLKCTYYHLGVTLELPSAQIDTADTFDSTLTSSNVTVSGGYNRCGTMYNGLGLKPPTAANPLNYNVHP